MANEDLIYRLTRAVYNRLGAGADEQTVEQLVTEVYREIEPHLSTNGSSYSPSPASSAGSRHTVDKRKLPLELRRHMTDSVAQLRVQSW